MAVRNAVDEAENKTVLVTGSTDGVGRMGATSMAGHPAPKFLAAATEI
jgi:NAD(P)-dependent dehydrogenase (short-subunit alcohol dehydrogenase family)